MDSNKFLTIREAARILGVSIDTLRRWDKKGALRASRLTPESHRYYLKEKIYDLLPKNDAATLARNWVINQKSTIPPQETYSETSDIFNARLERMGKELGKIEELKTTFPLIVAIAGEIGNNSFNHNIGNWPNIPGVFFSYDPHKRKVVLADRGQGILQTLKRVKPSLKTDKEALTTAFTEFISSRAPENRGNGLKFVRNVVTENGFDLFFQSGSTELHLKKGDKVLNIYESDMYVGGCLAIINF